MNDSHSFNVDVATTLKKAKLSAAIEKAILLKELYSCCQWKKSQKLKFGLPFWYASAQALEEKFPYLDGKSMARWLSELEEMGFIFSCCINTAKYDRTKSYTMNFEAYNNLTLRLLDISQREKWISHVKKSIAQDEKSISHDEEPIPTHSNTHSVSDISRENQKLNFQEEVQTDAYTEKYLELCNSFVKSVAPIGELDLAYRQLNYPATFQAAEAKDKLELFMSESTNISNTCAANSFGEGLKFSPGQWAEAIAQFIAYHFSPTGYQSNYCKDFPAIVRGFGIFLKRNKGALGKQRPDVVPSLESVLQVAQKAYSNPANPEAMRRFFAQDIITAIYGQVADKIKAVSEGSLCDMVPLSAEEFVRFVAGAMGRKDIIIKALETAPGTKRDTKYLDGYKTVFACLQAQTKYLLR